jgi:manganese transport protein
MSEAIKNQDHHRQSLSDVHQSVDTTGKQAPWRKIFAFFGPAYLISVGYMDPGNWATDLAGGSKYGYSLIWVLLMSNLIALLLQVLSARLGIVRSRDLAQANRETYPPVVNFILYLFAEIAIAACDLAEVLGMAIGIQLLTGLPLVVGVLLTVADTFIIFGLQRLGMRKLEAFIISLIAIIGFIFLYELLLAHPSGHEIVKGLVPRLADQGALYITIGIIGATVMPHNLYLHSALVQTRKINRDEKGIRQALRLNFADSAIALNLAFLVNVAILVLAAAVFFKVGRIQIPSIQQAYKLLSPLLGTRLAPLLFAIALIASGQSSTITGTLAGQIVMEGYLHLRINPWLRRLITRLLAVIPAVLVISIAGDAKVTGLIVLSQVLLSVQLGFAMIPLIHFVSNKKTMGAYVIKPWVSALSWLVVALLITLNLEMVWDAISGYFSTGGNPLIMVIIVVAAAGFLLLLAITFIYPLVGKPPVPEAARIHPSKIQLGPMEVPQYNRIAIALDFSKNDEKLISNAVSQGHPATHYVLIHIVESVSAQLLGTESFDEESISDQHQLDVYIRLLNERHVQATGVLGYRRRAQEIVRIVKQQQADLLVLGGHGHTGLKDWLYGETVNYVRHYVHIPVLIIN